MKILFLTISPLQRINYSGIYTDLMRKFRDEGHDVYIVSSVERRQGIPTNYKEIDGVHILSVKTLNLQKTNVVEKGVGQLLVESQYKKAIKKYMAGIDFDLILYTTPPITFPKVIAYLKRQNPQAKTYLLLKDIFPQNAVDLGMMTTGGAKGILYKMFRKKEVELYKLSDHIGCMSPANVEYVVRHNPEVDASKVEVAPNSVELCHTEITESTESTSVREKYGLPTDKPIFIYGGNLGKPQGIDYLIKCLDANKNRKDCYFMVVGNGTELPKLKAWYDNLNLNDNDNLNVTVMEGLPKAEYDELVRSCDVGLIFLDHRFTIPNFPSRLLPYLKLRMPVLCATDPNTDIGRIAKENGYGFWCESNSVEAFSAILDKMLRSDRKAMGEKGYEFLKENYTIDNTYNAIMSHV